MRPVQSSRHLYSGQRALSGSKLLGDIQQLLLGEQHPEKIWERCWQDELYRHPTLLVVAPKIGLTHPSRGGTERVATKVCAFSLPPSALVFLQPAVFLAAGSRKSSEAAKCKTASSGKV